MSNRGNNSFLIEAFLQQKNILAARLARFLLNPHDIEDILQETFLRAHTAENKQRIEKPQAYLFTIARNLAFKTISAQSRMVTQEIEDIDDRYLTSSEPAAADQLHYKEAYSALLEAVESLPPQCQKVFLLRKFYGLSQKEIAKKLGISRSTVERHITEAIKRCHKKMMRGGYEIASPHNNELPIAKEQTP